MLVRRYIQVIVLVLLALLAFCSNENNVASGQEDGDSTESGQVDNNGKPNFIFYLSDDQDMLDYGVYGNPNVKTPAVDRLAEEGMLFTNAYTAQAICTPSRSMLYTGRYPVHNGAMMNHIQTKPDMKSVTHYMKELGYEVILVGKSHVSPYQVYNWTDRFKSNNKDLSLARVEEYLSEKHGPFVMFIASDLPHGPYPSNNDYTEEDIVKHPYEDRKPNFKIGYYQNIEEDNRQVEAILELVDEYNYRENTALFYASDHGITGKFGLYENGLRIPFVVRWPGEVEAGTSTDKIITLADVLPTMIEIAGGTVPDDLDGESLLPLLKGKDSRIHDYIYGMATKQNIRKRKVFPSRMVRGERYKLIRNYNSEDVYESNQGRDDAVNYFIARGAEKHSGVPYEELYDLQNDPWETNNLANDPSLKEVKARLSDKLNEWMDQQGDFLVSPAESMLLKPTLHPLDEDDPEFNYDIKDEYINALQPEDYLDLHY